MSRRTLICRAALLATALSMTCSSDLSGAPRLTEFMASNDRVIEDEDGDFSDWIEVHNPDSVPLDLETYYLTDDPDDLTKWSFPAGTELAVDGYLVVFASGKNRGDAGGELHTNFQLDASGEYVALVAPDGTTVVSSFGSAETPFVRQRSDISYGSAAAAPEITLLSENGAVRYLIPDDDAALGEGWADPAYDDVHWQAGAFGIGFDLDGGDVGKSAPLHNWPLDDGFGVVARDTTGGFPGSLVGAGDASSFWSADSPPVVGGPESSLRFDGVASYIQTTFDGIGGSSSRTVVFWIRTSDTSDHGIVAWGDSTANSRKYHIRLNNNADNGMVGAIRCEVQGGYTIGSRVIADDQWHHVAVVYEEDASPEISDVRFYIDGVLEAKSGTAEMAIDTDIASGGADQFSIGRRVQGGSVGYFAGHLADVALYDVALPAEEVANLADGTIRPTGAIGFGDFIATDLAEEMHGVNASLFVRAAFDLPAGHAPDQLRLRLRYDDGFSAFLNGVEIARANAPSDDAWNDRALIARDDREAIQFAEFSASLALPALRPTGNVLALHGLNLSAIDRDVLLAGELIGAEIGGTSVGYFLAPTPGEANGEPDADAFVADTKFSVDRGFFDAPFDLEITSATEGAEIYYTLDGSEPTPASGELFSEPFAIGRTAIVRAAAFKEGQVPTNVDTHTYIFPEGVLRQSSRPSGFPTSWGSRTPDYEMDPDLIGTVYTDEQIVGSLRALPTISVVMDVDDLFDGSTGFYANTNSRGDQWEKRCSYEFFDFPDGAQTQLNGGIRAVGRASRSANRGKHNMRVVFRSEYGPTKLRFPLFPDSEVTEFNSLILRGGNGDSWINPGVVERAQYIRDQWHRDVQRATGQPFQHQIYAHLYINGLYWGMYHVFERFEDDMLAANFGGEEEDWDAIKDAGSPSALEVVNGDLNAWNRTLNLANRDLRDPDNYGVLLQFIDPDTWADYFLMNFYSGNTDWDQSNWRAGRKRERGAKWMLFAWDSERTDRNATQNANSSTNNVTGKNIANFPSSVHQKMTTSPEYRLSFADRVRLHCFNGGTLTPEGAAALWDARATEIFDPLIAEAVRWGDRHRSPAARRESPWRNMYTTMHRSFFPQRTDLLLGQLRARGLYPDVDAPDFVPHGAAFAAPSEVEISPTRGTIYYTLDGSDPRRPAAAGTTTALLPEGSPVRALVPSSDSLGDSWTAPDFDDASWQSGASGVGYEMDVGYEGLFGIDLSAMHGTNASAYARWEFQIADQATLEAIRSLTLSARYDDGFAAFLNGVPAISVNASETLSWNSTATIGHPDGAAAQFEDFDLAQLVGDLRVGTNVLAVHCLNERADSNDLLFVPEIRASTGIVEAGISANALVYGGVPVFLDRSARLSARVLSNGEWSALTTALYTIDAVPAGRGQLVISEIMYHPVDDAPTEFVEVMNISGQNLDLTGLAFGAGIDFTFPEATVLPPGERILVVEDVTAFQIAYGLDHLVAGSFENGTQLSNGGEQLVLLAADGSVIRDFEFRDDHPWPETPDGAGKSLVLIAPGTDPDHSNPLNWRASVAGDGNPGVADGMAFAGGSEEDLLAYALPDSGNLRISNEAGGLVLRFEQNVAADDVRVWIEYSPDLQVWSPAALEDYLAHEEHPDGTATVTFALTEPSPGPASLRSFARIRVDLR